MRCEKIIDELFLRSSWVIMVFFLSLFLYEKNLSLYKVERDELRGRLAKLSLEKAYLEKEREEIQKEVKMINESSWIALKLIDELGVVPLGSEKVLFNGD